MIKDNLGWILLMIFVIIAIFIIRRVYKGGAQKKQLKKKEN